MIADAAPRYIELAEEAAFALAGAEVRPATLEMIAGERRELLEPRVMQVLVALARRRGEMVSRDDLIAQCWGGRIVGEDAITRALAQLRKLAKSVGGFQIETVPRVGVRLVERREQTPRAPRRLSPVWIPLALLGLAVVVGLVTWPLRRSLVIETGPEPRIAFTAFEALEANPQTSAFAARLTDEVAAVLNEHTVGLGGPRPGLPASEANFRVGGSVRRHGETLRVRAYLEDGRASVTLWSRQFESAAGDEDALRTEVAVTLTDKLLNAMEPLDQKGLRLDQRTLALWLSALAEYGQGGTSPPASRIRRDPLAGVRAWEQVVERAPQFARARAMLAQSLVAASRGVVPAEQPELRRRARAEAERAIRTDPGTADTAYDALYVLARMEAPDDLAKAEEVWLWGLSRAPNRALGNMRRCQFLLDVGRILAAVPYCERAATLLPLGAPWGFRYARALAAAGEMERAEQVMARQVRFHPRNAVVRREQFDIRLFTGAIADARAMLHDPSSPASFNAVEREAFEALLKARESGAPGDAERAAATLRNAVTQDGMDPRYLFRGLIVLGRLDEAFEFAQGARPEMVAINGPGWLFEPGMEPLHRDPRFWPLAARIGLVRYWRERRVWPDFCDDPKYPMDCRAKAARASPA